MSLVMSGARASTRVRAPVRLQGAVIVHALPEPVGDAYSTVCVAARAWLTPGTRPKTHSRAARTVSRAARHE